MPTFPNLFRFLAGAENGLALVCQQLGELLTASKRPDPDNMLDQTYHLPQSASEIIGDLTAFAEQLGSAEELGQLALVAAAVGTAPVDSATALESFLNSYASGVLISYEIPAVIQAYEHAARTQVRELITVDKELSTIPVLQSFARASCAVGQAQLSRLRPLRGERVVQRYLQAVEAGEARGWHTLVYGLVLAVYSIPLRQGLVHFGQRTLDGFVQAAGHRLALAGSAQDRILAGPCSAMTGAIEDAIARHAVVPALQA